MAFPAALWASSAPIRSDSSLFTEKSTPYFEKYDNFAAVITSSGYEYLGSSLRVSFKTSSIAIFTAVYSVGADLKRTPSSRLVIKEVDTLALFS